MRKMMVALGVAVALTHSAALAHAETEPGLFEVTWRAEDIGGSGVLDNLASTVAISVSGLVSGSGGCNRLTSSAKVDGDAIAIAPVSSTRMLCPPAVMDQEKKFLDALVNARAYKIEGSFLRLFGEDGSELMRLVKSD